jgi:hypothetical protein
MDKLMKQTYLLPQRYAKETNIVESLVKQFKGKMFALSILTYWFVTFINSSKEIKPN